LSTSSLFSFTAVSMALCHHTSRVADLDTRRRLRSASTHALVVPPSRLSTVGDRALPVAAARVWNSLSDFVTASTSLPPMFKRHLKTVQFAKSYLTLAVSDDLNTFHHMSLYFAFNLVWCPCSHSDIMQPESYSFTN